MNSIVARLGGAFAVLIGLVVTMAVVVYLGALGVREADRVREEALGKLVHASETAAKVNRRRILIAEFVRTGTAASRNQALGSLSDLKAVAPAADPVDFRRLAERAIDAIVGSSEAGLKVNDIFAALGNPAIALLEASIDAGDATGTEGGARMLAAVARVRSALGEYRRLPGDDAAHRVEAELDKLAGAVKVHVLSARDRQRRQHLLDGLEASVARAREAFAAVRAADRARDAEVGRFLDALESLAKQAELNKREAEARFAEASRNAAAESSWIRSVTLFATVLILFAGVILAILLGRSITRPVLQLDAAMRAIGGGDLYAVIPGKDRSDEIGEMARTVEAFRAGLLHARALQDSERKAQEALREQQARLLSEVERQVEARTQELQSALAANQRASAELEVARCAADAGNRAKSEFLARMSHELRTPLNAIIGLVHILRRDLVDGRHRDSLGMLDSAARQLLVIINDLLDLSKIDSGHVKVIPERFSMDDAIVQVVDQIRAPVEEKGLELLVDLAGVPEEVIADGNRLSQILLNFLSNAVKFTETGFVALSATYKVAQDGARLRIEVADSGIGLTPEQRSLLFREFVQAEASITRKYGGTGLGLAIASRLAGLMGGSVGCESRIGEGSCFWVEIPVEPVVSSVEVGKARAAAGLRVLLGEHLPRTRVALRAQLEADGASVVEAANAAEALAQLQAVAARDAGFTLALLDEDCIATVAGAIPPSTRVFLLGSDRVGPVSRSAEIDAVLPRPILRRSLRDALAALAQPRAPRLGGSGADPCAARARDGRVLVVEDLPVNRFVVLDLLEHAGLAADVAEDGLVALEKVQQRHYDLILCDVQMPGMDGLEATRRIRALPGMARVPIIGMTANAFKQDADSCLQAGMNAHLPKPIDVVAFGRMLQAWLPASSQPDRPAPATEARGGGPSGPMGGPDWEAVLAHYGGRIEFVTRLVRLAVENYEETPDAIRRAVTERDLTALARIAHQMKSTAGNLCAVPLQTLAERTQADCADCAPGAFDSGAALEAELRETLRACRVWLDQRVAEAGA